MKTVVIYKGNKTTFFSKPSNSSDFIFPFIEQVPTKNLAPEHKRICKNDSSIGQVCSICYEDLTINENKRKLLCKHVFHKKCIDKWFKKGINCPICRTDLK